MIAPCYPITQASQQNTEDGKDKGAKCSKTLLDASLRSVSIELSSFIKLLVTSINCPDAIQSNIREFLSRASI